MNRNAKDSTNIISVMMTRKVTRIVVDIEIGRNLYDVPGA